MNYLEACLDFGRRVIVQGLCNAVAKHSAHNWICKHLQESNVPLLVIHVQAKWELECNRRLPFTMFIGCLQQCGLVVDNDEVYCQYK